MIPDRCVAGQPPAHLTPCVHWDGTVKFYPEGDPAQLEAGLRLALRTRREQPAAIRCAAGACDGGCGHAIRRH